MPWTLRPRVYDNVLFADDYYQQNSSIFGIDSSSEVLSGAHTRYLSYVSGGHSQSSTDVQPRSFWPQNVVKDLSRNECPAKAAAARRSNFFARWTAGLSLKPYCNFQKPGVLVCRKAMSAAAESKNKRAIFLVVNGDRVIASLHDRADADRLRSKLKGESLKVVADSGQFDKGEFLMVSQPPTAPSKSAGATHPPSTFSQPLF